MVETLGFFRLNSDFRVPNIEEGRESAVDILNNVKPLHCVKNGIHFADLADDDPVGPLTDFVARRVGLMWHSRGFFEADRAHVVVETVIDVGLILAAEAFFQV